MRHRNGSVAYCLTMSDDTVDAISAYPRVRSPTKEDKLPRSVLSCLLVSSPRRSEPDLFRAGWDMGKNLTSQI